MKTYKITFFSTSYKDIGMKMVESYDMMNALSRMNDTGEFVNADSIISVELQPTLK